MRIKPTQKIRVIAASALLLAGLVLLPQTAARAAPEPCWDTVRNDVDGGGPDVILGLPSYDLPGKPNAGAIVVFSDLAAEGVSNPSAPSARTVLTADDFTGLTSQADARFGASVVLWRDPGTNSDQCSNVLVGAPGQNVAGQAGAGRVYLLQGSAAGLGGVVRSYDEASLAGTGGAQAGANFGAAIAIDPSSMISIGAPRRDIGSAVDAGRVVQLDYRLSMTPTVRTVQQGGAGAGGPENGDRFGEVLDMFATFHGPLLMVGIPREDIGTKVDAGAVALMPDEGVLSMVTQDSPGAGGAVEAGDRYGAALDSWATFIEDHPVIMIVVGVPGEDIGNTANAGMVSYAAIDLLETELPPIKGLGVTMTQDTPGVPGSVEAGDAFGSAVATAEYGTDSGRQHVAVGAPLENLGTVVDAGMVTMTLIDIQTAMPVPGSQPDAWHQDSTGVGGVPERGDRLGSSLGSVQLATVQEDEDLVWALMLVNVEGEDRGTTADAGMAYLGVAPGNGSVELLPPSIQAGAGLGMLGMQMLVG